MLELFVKFVLEKYPYDSQNRKIDKYDLQIYLKIVKDNTAYTADDDRTGDDERPYHQIVFQLDILILHKVHSMYPRYLKSNPLNGKYTEDDVREDDDGSAKHHIATYLNDVQKDGKKVNMIDAYVFKKRLYKAVKRTYKHKDTDHIYGEICSLKLSNKG